MGSPDLYSDPGRQPHRSINFVTCHDGFTLNDLVSYNEKHNLANGEDNRDGLDANFSWNCGVEGPTDDPEIERLRVRQIKNFVAVLLASQGTPMIQMGAEARRTQGGNNNAYCQDNETSWLDWGKVAENGELRRFVSRMIHFRRNRPSLNSDIYVSEQRHGNGLPKHVTWHGVRLNRPDWGDASHSLAFTLHDYPGDDDMYVIVNAYWESLEFELPAIGDGRRWHRVVDTALDSPADISEPGEEPRVAAAAYPAEPRSVVILVAK
jgi:glycogen operon protein